jgi:hypothetical protein
VGGTQNVSFLGRRYFKLPILSCPRIPPATQAITDAACATPAERIKRGYGRTDDYG